MWTSRYVARSSGASAFYPVLVHRRARLLDASFRPRLATVALASSLGLHLHLVGQRTFTSELLSNAQHTTNPLTRGTLRVLLFGRATAMSKINCSIATSLRHRTRFRFNIRSAIALPNQRVPSNGCIESAPIGVAACSRPYSAGASDTALTFFVPNPALKFDLRCD